MPDLPGADTAEDPCDSGVKLLCGACENEGVYYEYIVFPVSLD